MSAKGNVFDDKYRIPTGSYGASVDNYGTSLSTGFKTPVQKQSTNRARKAD